jgi:hypothetical protein
MGGDIVGAGKLVQESKLNKPILVSVTNVPPCPSLFAMIFQVRI